MTDNRTIEPTETQIEAAVRAAWAKSREFRGVGGQTEFAPPWEFQQVIRAALEAAARAAQGAAPQAEQATYLNVAHSSVLAGSINARRPAREVSAMQLIDAIYDPDEDDANDSVRYGYVLEQFERLRIIYADLDDPDAGPAPVLPSSGVDEETLANLIHSTSVAHFGGLDPRVAPIIARAVAEWLKGQGGESREAV